jgi:hypothetical protein
VDGKDSGAVVGVHGLVDLKHSRSPGGILFDCINSSIFGCRYVPVECVTVPIYNTVVEPCMGFSSFLQDLTGMLRYIYVYIYTYTNVYPLHYYIACTGKSG